MLWEGDRCVALIDWNTAGAGDPGVDLGSLRMQVALQYGQDAPAHVLEGWQRQAGRAATAVPYWDAVAALNTPTVMQAWPGFADDGSPLDAEAVTERRGRVPPQRSRSAPDTNQLTDARAPAPQDLCQGRPSRSSLMAARSSLARPVRGSRRSAGSGQHCPTVCQTIRFSLFQCPSM